MARLPGDHELFMTIDVPPQKRRRPADANFDLSAIRLAVLCAELGSLTAACERVHCSLPAGSQRLAALEKALGARLFVRARRGLHATAAGERFMAVAPLILRHVKSICMEVTNLEDVAL